MDADVIVVGAGPTGLMLAGELRLGGASVVVAEVLDQPTGQSRGLGFTARAMETFDQRGLLPRFGEPESSPLGHFGGVQFDYTVLEDAHFGARGIPQSRTEAILEAWATRRGADVRRGWGFSRVDERDDGVTAVFDTAGGERRLSARYLVGCDGGHSAVRRAAGIEFPGTPATRLMYLADVVGCGLEPRFLGEQLTGGMVMAAPLEEGVDRIIVCPHGVPARDRDDEVTFGEVADAWRRITGEDISHGSAAWVSSFTDATRQASEYRRGRVLLAGDAAHIHLPAGGQGLSVGVQDAANLGWKLAAEVAGWAPQGLLDTYHDERHAVGRRLLTNTRAQGLVFLGDESADPLRGLLSELLQHDEVKRHLAGSVSHLDIRYDVGPGTHPLLGRRLPPRLLRTDAATTTTSELLHPARAVLLTLPGGEQLREAAAGMRDRVEIVAAALDGQETRSDPFQGLEGVLVRPDGYVAWTSADGEDLHTALERWLGAARTHVPGPEPVHAA